MRNNIDEDIDLHIRKLQKEAADKLTLANRLLKLKERYPDLRQILGYSGELGYASKLVNSTITDYDLFVNGGIVALWPYAMTNFGPVHSEPIRFVVAHANHGNWIPFENWDEDVVKAGIDPAIVKEVRKQVFRSYSATGLVGGA